MATAKQRAGLVTVKVDASAAQDTLETLGFTINGADISENPFLLPVYGDEHGGEAGPPIDYQNMGEEHDITLRLTKWDKTVEDKIRNALRSSGTPGQLPTPGQFLVQDDQYFRVVLDAADNDHDLDYPICIVKQPKTLNKGTRHEQLLFVFTALMSSTFKVYDATV